MPAKSASRAATSLLEEIWGDVDLTPLPVSPVSVARHLGITVYNAGFKRPDVSGMLSKQPGQDPKIYLNRHDHENRKRFTCAHEVGHYIKRAGSDSDSWAYVDRRDSMSSTGRDANEVFANQFAAELLMPAARVRREWELSKSKAAMAVRFGVSIEAMGHRLANLRLA